MESCTRGVEKVWTCAENDMHEGKGGGEVLSLLFFIIIIIIIIIIDSFDKTVYFTVTTNEC